MTYYDDEAEYRYMTFHDPTGTSALHAGARTLPCPTCDRPNRLTARDKAAGYQCDSCADACE